MNCAYCGNIITPNYFTNPSEPEYKYCSKVCADKAISEIDREGRKYIDEVVGKKTCKCCGAGFLPSRGWGSDEAPDYCTHYCMIFHQNNYCGPLPVYTGEVYIPKQIVVEESSYYETETIVPEEEEGSPTPEGFVFYENHLREENKFCDEDTFNVVSNSNDQVSFTIPGLINEHKRKANSYVFRLYTNEARELDGTIENPVLLYQSRAINLDSNSQTSSKRIDLEITDPLYDGIYVIAQILYPEFYNDEMYWESLLTESYIYKDGELINIIDYDSLISAPPLPEIIDRNFDYRRLDANSVKVDIDILFNGYVKNARCLPNMRIRLIALDSEGEELYTQFVNKIIPEVNNDGSYSIKTKGNTKYSSSYQSIVFNLDKTQINLIDCFAVEIDEYVHGEWENILEDGCYLSEL